MITCELCKTESEDSCCVEGLGICCECSKTNSNQLRNLLIQKSLKKVQDYGFGSFIVMDSLGNPVMSLHLSKADIDFIRGTVLNYTFTDEKE